MLQPLTTFAAETTAEESSEGIAALGLDPFAMLWQAGTFLLIFLIVRKYMLSNIVASLEARREKIAEGLRSAEQLEQQRAEMEAEVKKTLKTAHQEAANVIAKAHEEAGQIIADSETKAGKRAESIVSQAQAQAEVEVNEARKALKSEMLGLVTEATETILSEKVDSDKDKKIIKRAVAKETA